MRILICLGVVVTAACSPSLGPADEVRVLGTIVSIERIEVPDTVSVSTPFTVSVVTVGDSCHRVGDTEVDLSDNTATIFPYDWSSSRGDGGSAEFCLFGLWSFEHLATVEFDAVGAGTIIVQGRALGSRSPVEFQFSVWVE